MKVVIADVVFQYDQRLLQKGENKRNLEPKVFSLLTALIAANGGIVSREQLIADVWNNRVVGESAINRTVSLLRAHFSALTDIDVIETVPTQGYRLSVSVSDREREVSPPNSQAKTATTKSLNTNVKLALLSAFLLILLAIYLSAVPNKFISPQPLKLVSGPFVGLTGWEYGISASNDGKKVLFHYLTPDEQQSVILYDTGSHQQEELFSNALAAISPDGKQVAYFQTNNDKCTLVLLDLSTKAKSELFQCESPPATIKWSNNNYLYFNTRLSKSHPFQIFRFHVETKHRQQLTNPNNENNTRGDFKFAVNLNSENIAVLNYLDGSKTKVTTYQGQVQLQSLIINKGLKNVIWHPNNKDLLVTDRNAIYQLTLDNNELTEIHQTNSTINSLAVIHQDQQASLLVSDARVKSHIQQFDITKATNSVWQQSGGTELLPRTQADTHLVLSTRYHEHKWWRQKDGQVKLIDVNLPFDLKFERYELSDNGKHLILSKHGAVYEVDIEQETAIQILDESNAVYVVNYDKPNSIIYSSNRTGQWQLWQYQRSTKNHKQLTTAGGYSGRVWNDYLYYTKYAVDGLWRKKLDSEQESLVVEDFDRINWLNWQIINNHLYFYRPETGIWRYNLMNKSTELVMKTESRFIHQYSVSPDQSKIYWVQRSSIEGDINQYGYFTK